MRSALLAFCLAPALLLALPAAAQATEPAAPEWLDARIAVTFADLTHARVAGALRVHQLVVQDATHTAQSLRDAHAQANRFGMGSAFVAQVDAMLEGRAEQALASMFPGAAVTVRDAGVNASTLAAPAGPDPFHPPVEFTFDADVAYTLEALGFGGGALDLDEAKLRALMDLGVRVSVPYDLAARPGWNVTYAFQLPPWLQLARADGATVSPDGASATWLFANWLEPTTRLSPTTLVLQSRAAPPASEAPSDAHLDLVVDMRDVVGLTLPGALRGDFGRLQVAFDATLTLRTVRLEDVPSLQAMVEDRLPAGVAIDRINADGLRIAMRDGLLPPDALDRLEQELSGLASARAGAFGAELGAIEGSFAADALAPGHISSPPDDDPPLVFAVHASFLLPLGAAGAEEFAAAAAIGPNLLERELSFALPRVQGLDTTYRILLPEGIALTSVEADGATYERGTQGGREVVLLTPQGDDAQATFHIAVTGGFVLAKFWYLGLGLLLVGALGVVALLARRRRKRGRKAAPAEPPAAEPASAPELAPVARSQPEAGTRAPRSEP